MEQYWIWLSSVRGVGPATFATLCKRFSDPRGVWDAAAHDALGNLSPELAANLRKAATKSVFDKIFDTLDERGILPITKLSPCYSTLLADIHAAPLTLYVRGNPDLQLTNPVAIVGTRAASYEGKRTAQEFAKRLALSGATVVSGLARGIDTCAHTGCLQGMGRTVAVLGSGVDKIYPSENVRLSEEIIGAGGSIVSEYPPGTEPSAGNFPARNRIISGLSLGSLLVEGGVKSGGLITMEYALEQGRDVFCVPGSIYAPMAQGPNSLLMRGALPVVSPYDIPEHYRLAARPAPPQKRTSRKKEETLTLTPEQMSLPVGEKEPSAGPRFTPDEQKILGCLAQSPLTRGELGRETGFPTANLSTLLTMLEIRGIICKTADSVYHIVI